MVNLSVYTLFLHDGGETVSGVSSSIYPLIVGFMDYHAPVLLGGSLTRMMENGPSAFVGSVENLVSDRL